MAFFDELSNKILNTSKTAVSKAKEVADITKLKTEIISEESKIKTIYAEIGKLYCDQAEGEIAPEFQPLLEKVAVAKAAIAEYKAEIQKIKGTNQCQECGAEVSEDSQFCSACGAPVPPREENTVEKEPLKEDDSCTCGCTEETDHCDEAAAEKEEGCCCSDKTEE